MKSLSSSLMEWNLRQVISLTQSSRSQHKNNQNLQNEKQLKLNKQLVLSRKLGRLVIKQNIKNRSEEHTSELQSRFDLVCRLLLEKKKHKPQTKATTQPTNGRRRGTQ